MASSENMKSVELWEFRPTYENSWMSEAFARETEAITKALTHSITNTMSENVSFSDIQTILNSETPSSLPNQQQQSVQSVSSSGGGSSETETLSVSKRPPRNPASGRITKRKSRASKRSPTTFITADPANFRQMVQQVTGVRFGSGQVGSVFKPEPQRPGFGGVVGGLQGVVGSGTCLLPTLDTSAFLLDHHQQVVGPSGAHGNVGFGPSAGGVVAEGGGPGLDFDGFSCYPTLESYVV